MPICFSNGICGISGIYLSKSFKAVAWQSIQPHWKKLAKVDKVLPAYKHIRPVFAGWV